MSQIANFLTQVAVGISDLFIKRLKPSDGVIDHLTYGVSDRGLDIPALIVEYPGGPAHEPQAPAVSAAHRRLRSWGPIVHRDLRHRRRLILQARDNVGQDLHHPLVLNSNPLPDALIDIVDRQEGCVELALACAFARGGGPSRRCVRASASSPVSGRTPSAS
jgi:hypothetical protein